ncbi:hypothetical protein ACTG9Q_02485 [Actinokineospora sp. 24-640]
MSPDLLPPTGTATADLLTLEFADPPPAATGATGPREAPEHAYPIGPAPRAPRTSPVLDHLDARMVEFIDRAGQGHVATADAAGHCESSFREVRVLDPHRIAYPGDDGPPPAAVGVLLVDFAAEPVGLHVNGRACEDAALPAGWVVVEVAEARLHRGAAADG